MKSWTRSAVISLVWVCCAQVHGQELPQPPSEPSPQEQPQASDTQPIADKVLPSVETPQVPTAPETTALPQTSAAPEPDAMAGASDYAAQPQAGPEGDMGLLMSSEELAALGIASAESPIDTSLRFSGFADGGFGFTLAADDSYWRASGSAPGHSTFYVGNINLYAQKRITANVSSMAEIRFTYLPNGSGAFGFGERESTRAFDYTDFGRATRWGSIIIQRIYLDWSPHPLITFRIGQFLTPYGIWNVDHGSPVYIPVKRPWSIGVGWIPERQTGLEVYGRAEVSAASTVGYHLTLSNGTGPVSDYADLDENKAIGGRLYWEVRGLGFGWLRLGASAYYGRDTDSSSTVTISQSDKYSSQETIASQYDSLTWAGDLTWDLGGLHVQTEWLANQRAFTKKGRVATTTLANRPLLPSDVFSWGGYGLIGYRFDWLGIMPFILSERVIGELEYLKIKLYTIQLGLNVRPIDEVVVKATWEHVVFEDNSVEPGNVIMTQVAWAF